MKNRKFLNYMLLMISIVFTILFLSTNSVTASSVAVLKGNDAIKDVSNNIVYYKSGVVSKNTGTVNLIKKDKKTGVSKVITKVDANPFYLQDNYIYYTTNTGIYRIKTDGTNKKQLVSLVTKISRQQILGLNNNYIYYSRYIYSEDTNKMVIGRININGSNHLIIKELTDYYSYDHPVLTNNLIYYVTRTSDHKLSLKSTTLDGKTTKNEIKSADLIAEMKGNKNGLYFVYQKEYTTDYIIRKIDSTGIITNLMTIENELYTRITLSCFEDDYLYYSLNDKIYQITYDGKKHQFIYDTNNFIYNNDYIGEMCIKGDWMIIRMDNDSSFPTYCVKKDGSNQIYLGKQCYSNSFDILSNTIYYRVVTIPGDDEDFTYNDENIFRKLTLPLKEYE